MAQTAEIFSHVRSLRHVLLQIKFHLLTTLLRDMNYLNYFLNENFGDLEDLILILQYTWHDEFHLNLIFCCCESALQMLLNITKIREKKIL